MHLGRRLSAFTIAAVVFGFHTQDSSLGSQLPHPRAHCQDCGAGPAHADAHRYAEYVAWRKVAATGSAGHNEHGAALRESGSSSPPHHQGGGASHHASIAQDPWFGGFGGLGAGWTGNAGTDDISPGDGTTPGDTTTPGTDGDGGTDTGGGGTGDGGSGGGGTDGGAGGPASGGGPDNGGPSNWEPGTIDPPPSTTDPSTGGTTGGTTGGSSHPPPANTPAAATDVPEPASLALVLAGFTGLLVLRRRRRRA